MNTTTALQTFDFHTNAVRVHVEGEHVEYCAKDIAAALGYTNTNKAIGDHCRGVTNRYPILDSLGRTQEAVFIGEGDVYRLIASSKLPAAVEFEHWLFDEVLPSIRRHGGYMMGQESMSPEEMALASLKWLQSVVDEQKRQIEAQKPKVVFADALTASNKDILVGELAKVLKQNGVNIGQNRLFAWLRDHGYLMKRNGIRNFPTQKAQDMDLFFVKAKPVQLPDGSTITSYTTKVTPKGQMYFINKFLKEQVEA